MSSVPTKLLTPAEYLARERAAEFKSELYKGEMFAMAGAGERHNLICSAIIAAAVPSLRARGCEVYGSDMRVKVADSGSYTYPDVLIACGKIEFEDEVRDTLLNPCVIFGVLSKSTERRDRGWKFDKYCRLPSLVDYVLISQEQSLVEHFVRQPDDNWVLERLKNLRAVLKLNAVDCAIPLSQIYGDVEIGPEGEAPPTASQS